MMKPKFDGYAAQYDTWFMENDNLFQSELRLFQTALGDIAGKRVLSRQMRASGPPYSWSCR